MALLIRKVLKFQRFAGTSQMYHSGKYISYNTITPREQRSHKTAKTGKKATVTVPV